MWKTGKGVKVLFHERLLVRSYQVNTSCKPVATFLSKEENHEKMDDTLYDDVFDYRVRSNSDKLRGHTVSEWDSVAGISG